MGPLDIELLPLDLFDRAKAGNRSRRGGSSDLFFLPCGTTRTFLGVMFLNPPCETKSCCVSDPLSWYSYCALSCLSKRYVLSSLFSRLSSDIQRRFLSLCSSLRYAASMIKSVDFSAVVPFAETISSPTITLFLVLSSQQLGYLSC